jgi:hypothetical protein
MSKQKKTKTKAAARKASSKSRKKGMALPIAGVLLIVAAAVGYFMFVKQPKPAELHAASANCPMEGVKRLERRPVLPPDLFVGRVKSAYAAAKAIPAVVDQLYCYCHCRENIGHKSLLSCYAGTHAAGCDVCIVEAEMAAQMTGKGYCPAEIQQAIDKRFGKI